MEFSGNTKSYKHEKTHSSIITHKKSTSLQTSSIQQMQSKLSQLQEKYSSFITAWLSTFSNTSLSDKNNKNNLDLTKEMKKYLNDSSPSEDKTHISQIVNNFMSISRLIPSEYESEFINFKTNTLKYIFRLQNPVPKAFQSTSPEHQHTSIKKQDNSISKIPKVKDSNRETEETSLIFHTGDLSRDSSKNANKNHFVTNKRNVPRLRLNRIEEFSPIQNKDDRKCISTARLKKNSAFHTLRDSINPENSVVEVRLRETLKLTRSFLRSLQNLCENCSDPMEIFQVIVRKCDDFYCMLGNIESIESNWTVDESRLKEELENCKKVAGMLEQRVKVKNETILVLRKKEREWVDKSDQIRKVLDLFNKEHLFREHELCEKIIARIEKLMARFIDIQGKIEKFLAAGLEEIKKAVEMTSKNNEFYNPRDEEQNKQIEELEFTNRNLFEKCKQLEIENNELRFKCLELDNSIQNLQHSHEDSNSVLTELDNMTDQINNLKKTLKIKEFELKQKEFEKSELDADKNELLSRIESLEIEKIESHECINSLAIKYNQEIENFVYNNTIQRNQIQALEKEKEESAKTKKELEVKIENLIKENSALKITSSKTEELTKLNQNYQKKIQDLNSQIKTKQELEKKIVELEGKAKESLELKIKIDELEKMNQNLGEIIMENQEKLNKLQQDQESDLLKPSLDSESEIIESLKLRISELQSNEFALQDQVKQLTGKIQKLRDRYSKLKAEILENEEKSQIDDKVQEQEQLRVVVRELEEKNREMIEEIRIKDKEIKSLTGKVKRRKEEKLQIEEKSESLNSNLAKILEEKEKLESVNKYLIEDIKNRHKSYIESIEDLKLDKYQYEKALKDYETKLDSISSNFISLKEKLDSISPIPETLSECLTESRKQNEIDSHTKEIYLNKINQLEEDVKNITSKLMKKNNENSILEDCLLVYSPKSKTQSSDELAKIKYELLETHKLLELSQTESSSLKSQLLSGTNQIEELKAQTLNLKESLTSLQTSLKSKSKENHKLNNKLEELQNENEKLCKSLNEAKSKLKNSEVTYSKNLSYLEEQVKKYKNDSESSFDKNNSILSPRSFTTELRLSKESSLIIPSADKNYFDSPILSSRVAEEDSIEESSFKLN